MQDFLVSFEHSLELGSDGRENNAAVFLGNLESLAFLKTQLVYYIHGDGGHKTGSDFSQGNFAHKL